MLNKKRLILYCHYNPKNTIDKYVMHFIEKMQCYGNIIFLSHSQFSAEELLRVKQFTMQVHVEENKGFDFYCWKQFIESNIDLIKSYDELILTNSSIAGPMFNVDKLFETMNDKDSDFWGISDNYERQYHIQSYFLVFKKSILISKSFIEFWNNVKALATKEDVINNYEIKMTKYFNDLGFKHSVFFECDKDNVSNPTVFAPFLMMHNKVPFIKVKILNSMINKLSCVI